MLSTFALTADNNALNNPYFPTWTLLSIRFFYAWGTPRWRIVTVAKLLVTWVKPSNWGRGQLRYLFSYFYWFLFITTTIYKKNYNRSTSLTAVCIYFWQKAVLGWDINCDLCASRWAALTSEGSSRSSLWIPVTLMSRLERVGLVSGGNTMSLVISWRQFME